MNFARGKALNHMALEVSSKPENVGVARVAVATFAASADWPLSAIEEIKLVVSEAVTNAVLYAYDEAAGGIIRVESALYEDGIEIVVRDWGVGIPDVNLARSASYSTDPDRMGLGFTFMESFSDELDVESVPGHGTTVRIWKAIAQKDLK